MNKRLFILLLTLMMTVFLLSCSNGQPDDRPGVWTLPESMDPVEVDDPVTYLLLRMQKEGEYDYIINVWKNDEGQCEINYNVAQHKEGVFDEAVLHNITAAVNEAAIDGLDSVTTAGGNESATINVTYQSGKSIISDFAGQVPDDFSKAFDKINKFFLELTSELPIAEIQATVEGDADEEILAALNEALKEVRHIDEFTIYDAADNGEYSASLGLTNTDDVKSGAVCAPAMGTTLFRLEIVTLRDASNVKSVAEDFAANINWDQWVCVAPDKVWIGSKGNMVMYVIGDDMTVMETAKSAKNAGWAEIKSLKRP